MPAIRSVRGANDLLPEEMTAWDWLYRTHAQTAGLHGFRPLETPIFEHTEMFERGIGAGTDVVDKEMYTFTDKGGDSLTLRPENTPAAVRAVLSAHLDQQLRPVRVHYAGPMFRRDNPQKGRYRQFHQVGIEAIGERSADLDVEVIEVGWRFFAKLGLEGVSLQINTLGDLEDRIKYRAALVEYFTPLREQLCSDCQRRLELNPMRLLDCKRDAGLSGGAPNLENFLSSDSQEFFAAVLAGLDEAKIPYTRNHRLVRGLDYYAHTTFEWWHTSLQGAQNALGGGGRYDGLAEVLGFPATPGVGYALGCERILLVAAELGLTPEAEAKAHIVVCPLSSEQNLVAAHTARIIRGEGHAVVVDASKRKLDKKLRDTERQGARWAIVIGEREMEQRTVGLRDMVSGKSEEVGAKELLGRLR